MMHEKAIVAGITICAVSQHVLSFMAPSSPRVSSLPVVGPGSMQLWRSRRLLQLGINLNSNDPFEILDLQLTPNLDKQQIKRAYKRLALTYHPDVVTNSSSTPEEKKIAGDVFSKINWAYATLSGKNVESKSNAATPSSSSSKNTRSGSGAYEPPHRRTSSGSYRSTNPNVSTDWRDYMPKYDEEDAKFDTGGDSFEKILSDIFSGVSGATAGAVGLAGGGGGVFRDFVEFLERNVEGFSGDEDQTDLQTLLLTGTLEEVANEMDDTDLVVEQLSNKLTNIDNELIMIQADIKVTAKFSEKLDLSERIAELEARKKVIKGYIDTARKRLLTLQTRYKSMIVGGSNDRRAGGRTSSSTASSNRSYASAAADSSTSTSSTTSHRADVSDSEGEDSWKSQGFSASGRRGSSRRRRGETPSDSPQTPPPRREPAYGPSYDNIPQNSSMPPRNEKREDQATLNSLNWSVPPHRRTSNSQSDDKRRLREIKVDEEFDKLKKDLGL